MPSGDLDGGHPAAHALGHRSEIAMYRGIGLVIAVVAQTPSDRPAPDPMTGAPQAVEAARRRYSAVDGGGPHGEAGRQDG